MLTGSVSGDRITGSWWDVPKGTRSDKGSLDLRWSQAGAKIVRSGGSDLGPDVFSSIPPEAVPWPYTQVAGFQSEKAGDLDGAFVGDDASRHYVRETASHAVWVAERASQPGERPGWVSVFVGTRTSVGVSGVYVDVPKGSAVSSGRFGATVGSNRVLGLQQLGIQRTHSLTPDYALDWNGFASGIASKLDGKVVGYAYAIARNGALLRSGAWGSRRLSIDGGKLPFTTHTQAQTASAAKTITATAMIKALHDRGLTVDAKIEPFLPSCWKRGFQIPTLTFRELLNHTSRLPQMGNACDADPYGCLVKMIAQGRTAPWGYDYNTHAYDLFRMLVPLADDPAGSKGQFELFDCKNPSEQLNQDISEKFAHYLFNEIFDPAEVEASFYSSGDYSLNYDYNRAKGSN